MNANPGNESPSQPPAGDQAGNESPWRRRQILDATVLVPLAELNRDFLDLLRDAPRRWSGSSGNGRLPDPVHLALTTLAPRDRELLTSCPFTLFGARFRDDSLWMGLAEGNPAPRSYMTADAELIRQRNFAQSALFFVWHVVNSNPPAARMIFAMSEGTLQALRRMSLARLQQVAHDLPHLFVPRWSRRPDFWAALIEELSLGGAFPSRAYLLGVQMLAAEKAEVSAQRSSDESDRQ